MSGKGSSLYIILENWLRIVTDLQAGNIYALCKPYSRLLEDAYQNLLMILPDPLVASSHSIWEPGGAGALGEVSREVSPDGGLDSLRWEGLQILSYLILHAGLIAITYLGPFKYNSLVNN